MSQFQILLRKSAALLYPGIPYEDAREILETTLRACNRSDRIDRQLEVQSMLVRNDPLVETIFNIIQSKYTFHECFNSACAHQWSKRNPYHIRLGKKQYIFPNRRACMLFCYHPRIVSKWKSLPGAPRNIRVPQKQWAFGKAALLEQRPAQRQSTVERDEKEQSTVERDEKEPSPEKVAQEVRNDEDGPLDLRTLVPILEKTISWADACDSDYED